MHVERREHPAEPGTPAWTEFLFRLGRRRYRAEHRLGSGVNVVSIGESRLGRVATLVRRGGRASKADLEAIAAYLARVPGIRKVYSADERLYPPRPVSPRRLADGERALLDHLLAVDDAGVNSLRAQAQHALVEDDGDLPFRLWLGFPDGVTLPASSLPDQAPITADSTRTDAAMVTVSLWLDTGRLRSIDVAWYQDEPAGLPGPAELRPARLAQRPGP